MVRPLVDVRPHGRAGELLRRTAPDLRGQAKPRALDDEVDRLQVVHLRERAHGRLVLDRDLGERVAWLDDVRDRRRRGSRQHRRTATAAECGQGRGAGDPVHCEAPGLLEASEGGLGRRAEVAIDVEQPEMARPREQELERRDVPPVRALHEHASGDEGPAERTELRARARAELTGDREPRQPLERAQPLGGHRPRDTVDLAEVHPLRAQRDLEACDLGIRRGERARRRDQGAGDQSENQGTQTHGTDHLGTGLQPPASLYKSTIFRAVSVLVTSRQISLDRASTGRGQGSEGDSRHSRADSRATVGAARNAVRRPSEGDPSGDRGLPAEARRGGDDRRQASSRGWTRTHNLRLADRPLPFAGIRPLSES